MSQRGRGRTVNLMGGHYIVKERAAEGRVFFRERM